MQTLCLVPLMKIMALMKFKITIIATGFEQPQLVEQPVVEKKQPVVAKENVRPAHQQNPGSR